MKNYFVYVVIFNYYSCESPYVHLVNVYSSKEEAYEFALRKNKNHFYQEYYFVKEEYDKRILGSL